MIYPPVKWFYVLVAYAITPLFALPNSYGCGLTDWDMCSMVRALLYDMCSMVSAPLQQATSLSEDFSNSGVADRAVLLFSLIFLAPESLLCPFTCLHKVEGADMAE